MVSYAERFRCIGSECEDTCCSGWTVPVDKATWERYQQLPPSPLRVLIHANVEKIEKPDSAHADSANPDALTPSDAVYAKLKMDADNQCPLLTSERLCGIQTALGEQMLSHACATYPRIVHRVGDVQEKALALSCPEAARVVLLDPALLYRELRSAQQPMRAEASDANEGEGESFVPAEFWAVRAVVLRLIGNRSYPLWQRLFLLGVLCRRLDAMAGEAPNGSTEQFLADFESTISNGSLRGSMDELPLDLEAQLDVVLRLAGLMLHRSNVRARFVESVQQFTAGIGNGPGCTLKSLTAQYRRVHDRYFEPFLRQHPYMLENYLVNTIIRTQFPFGKEGMKPGATPDRTREFALLTAQFALTRGLLIGVAGFHGDAFDTPDIIQSVQSAAKHFEHHPEFLKLAHELLVESRMDGARGLAILLRHDGPEATSERATPASAGISAAALPDERSAWAAGSTGTGLPA